MPGLMYRGAAQDRHTRTRNTEARLAECVRQRAKLCGNLQTQHYKSVRIARG